MIASIYYIDEQHYDIKGSVYKTFLDKCFHYSSYFSIVSPRDDGVKRLINNDKLFMSLEPYLVLKKQTKEWPGNILTTQSETGYTAPVIYYIYKCTNETREIIKSVCDSLFSWYKGLPEDLSFYYPDKKIFLYSVTHEGDCVLSCNPTVFREFSSFNFWNIDSPTDFLLETYF